MTYEEKIARVKGNFIAFIFVLWAALSMPVPTRCQIDMARYLVRKDRSQRFIIQAFRGIGKSWITCAFVVWLLWNNPQLKIMIVSASKERADANSIFIKRIINLLDFLQELKPRDGQRDSVLSFDVGLARPDHSPSVKSVGITGQLTGSRADIIIADDVEVPNNSMTQSARDKLWELVKEFEAIIKPDDECMIIYLGTPQTEMTLYKELEDNRGYTTCIWTARYPADDEALEGYRGRLAKLLLDDIAKYGKSIYWTPTDIVRFSDEDLRRRELSYGKSGFALQFMLNPNLSDLERYPLKLRDLIIAAVGIDLAPMSYMWLPNNGNLLGDLPNIGLTGDRYHQYESASKNSGEYTFKIMVIDPSGRGGDETAYAILYYLNGYIYIMEVGGMIGGYSDEVLAFLAGRAKQYKVHEVVIEGNFGDGMFSKLFEPVLYQKHVCTLVETKSKGQKEVRIADVLEPLTGSHRLIFTVDALVKDFNTAKDKDGNQSPTYCFAYQYTRLTRDRGALGHDDRLDSVAIGCQYLVELMSVDSSKNESQVTEDWLEEQLSKDIHNYESVSTIQHNGVTIVIGNNDFNNNINFMNNWR